MGYGNAGAHGKADKQVDDQVGDCAGSAHCSNGSTAAESAHNYKIGSVEQKLQDTGQHQRKGIDQHL